MRLLLIALYKYPYLLTYLLTYTEISRAFFGLKKADRVQPTNVWCVYQYSRANNFSRDHHFPRKTEIIQTKTRPTDAVCKIMPAVLVT